MHRILLAMGLAAALAGCNRQEASVGMAAATNTSVSNAENSLVLGTAVAPNNRSFAFCRMPDGPAMIVRVGDKVGTYTVKSIDRNQVVFFAPGEEPFAVNATKQ